MLQKWLPSLEDTSTLLDHQPEIVASQLRQVRMGLVLGPYRVSTPGIQTSRPSHVFDAVEITSYLKAVTKADKEQKGQEDLEPADGCALVFPVEAGWTRPGRLSMVLFLKSIKRRKYFYLVLVFIHDGAG